MALIREIGIAVRIVIITLWLQSAGLAALIHWVRHALASEAHKLGPFRSAVRVVRLAAAVIVLHGVLNSILGELLSPALFLVLGIRPLFLG